MNIDLGASRRLYGVGIACWKSGIRKTNLKISVSEDGESFTTIFAGYSTVDVDDLEVFPTGSLNARYIKVECYGTTAGDWNSILEIAAIGE